MKKRILIITLFLNILSSNCFGVTNYYNQLVEWWNGDTISIESKHSKIFKKHIKTRGWDTSPKSTEKTNFILDINDKTFATLRDKVITGLESYDSIIQAMKSEDNYSLNNLTNEFIEPIRNNLDSIIQILTQYKKKFKGKNGQIIDINDKNFIRLIKCFPIIENLYQIFSLILACKDTNLSLKQVYKLFEENIPAGRARVYIKLCKNFELIIKYGRSAVSTKELNEYNIGTNNLSQIYNQVLSDSAASYVNQLSEYRFNNSSIMELMKNGVHPEQLKNFMALGLDQEQSINFAKKYNLNPQTISLLVQQEA